MSPETARIYPLETDVRDAMSVPIDKRDLERVVTMDIPKRKNWMRNETCPCGSKKKFKRCCWAAYA